MPNSEEMYGADIEEKEYNEGIMYGTSKATVGMSVNHMAKEHIAKENKEAEVLEKVVKQARRLSNGYKNTKEALFEEVKNSSLYHWALEMEELTFKARKDAKLQNELNAKFEAMADEAVAQGLPRKQAYTFAAQAVLGSAQMVLETGMHPGALKDMVCSPGGTTIDAVCELERTGFRASVESAMRVCNEKSKKMTEGK